MCVRSVRASDYLSLPPGLLPESWQLLGILALLGTNSVTKAYASMATDILTAALSASSQYAACSDHVCVYTSQ